jgi:hypothetical protein
MSRSSHYPYQNDNVSGPAVANRDPPMREFFPKNRKRSDQKRTSLTSASPAWGAGATRHRAEVPNTSRRGSRDRHARSDGVSAGWSPGPRPGHRKRGRPSPSCVASLCGPPGSPDQRSGSTTVPRASASIVSATSLHRRRAAPEAGFGSVACSIRLDVRFASGPARCSDATSLCSSNGFSLRPRFCTRPRSH